MAEKESKICINPDCLLNRGYMRAALNPNRIVKVINSLDAHPDIVESLHKSMQLTADANKDNAEADQLASVKLVFAFGVATCLAMDEIGVDELGSKEPTVNSDHKKEMVN